MTLRRLAFAVAGTLGAFAAQAGDLDWVWTIESHPEDIKSVSSADAEFDVSTRCWATAYGLFGSVFETYFGNEVRVDGLNLDSTPTGMCVIFR